MIQGLKDEHNSCRGQALFTTLWPAAFLKTGGQARLLLKRRTMLQGSKDEQTIYVLRLIF